MVSLLRMGILCWGGEWALSWRLVTQRSARKLWISTLTLNKSDLRPVKWTTEPCKKWKHGFTYTTLGITCCVDLHNTRKMFRVFCDANGWHVMRDKLWLISRAPPFCVYAYANFFLSFSVLLLPDVVWEILCEWNSTHFSFYLTVVKVFKIAIWVDLESYFPYLKKNSKRFFACHSSHSNVTNTPFNSHKCGFDIMSRLCACGRQ